MVVPHFRKGLPIGFQVAVAQEERIPSGGRRKCFLDGDLAVEPCLAVGEELAQGFLSGGSGVDGLRERGKLQSLFAS
jgi:hypothetical protein